MLRKSAVRSSTSPSKSVRFDHNVTVHTYTKETDAEASYEDRQSPSDENEEAKKEESLLQKRTFTDANLEFEKPEELPVHFGRKGSAAQHQKLRQQKEEVKDTVQKRKLETNLEDKYGKGLKLL